MGSCCQVYGKYGVGTYARMRTNHRPSTIYNIPWKGFDYVQDLLVETAASYHQDTHRTKEQR